jgi:putative methyltransferase (TIGR04325 family)
VGGGLGIAFIDLMYSLLRKTVSVKVVELLSIVSRGREIFKAYPGISFVDILPDDNEHFDVVYFGSSLQYFEDYRNMVQSVIDLHPEIIVIADTTMGEVATFVAAQVNMPGRVIPRLVFNLHEIVQLFASNSYELLHKSINYSLSHDFSNYPAPISATRHWNLVFGRSSS